ncbi:MAG: TerB family tellurite resistance protein [Planctomycetota bacterium]|jgi:tellurite resistance protein
MGLLPSAILLFVLLPAAFVSLLLICRPDLKIDFTRKSLAELIKVTHELFSDLSIQKLKKHIQALGNIKDLSIFKKKSNYELINSQTDNDELKCRICLIDQKTNDTETEVFGVEIRGRIRSLEENSQTLLQVSIADITDGIKNLKPVHSRVPQYRRHNSQLFCYKTDLGKLPNQVTTISDWMNVGQIHTNWLMFPSRGTCDLLFNIKISSREAGRELAKLRHCISYENFKYGYMDLEHNLILTKTLAVALGFSVSAADNNQIADCKIKLIKDWLMKNTDCSRASFRDKYRLKKAFNKTYKFFREKKKINVYNICKETVGISSVAQRYDILEFCMLVARAEGAVSKEELKLLKNISDWLELDYDRFRELMEKIIPASMHNVEDIEVLFGVTPDMTKEQTRQLLNKEYRKWNARVTHSDSQVKNQADHMLELIAETRNQYLE